jgi:hypothetical protein
VSVSFGSVESELTLPHSRPVPFHQHLADVVSIYNTLASRVYTASALPTGILWDVSQFVLYRTQLKQSARLADGKKFWGLHPITIICDHYSAHPTNLTSTLLVKIPRNKFFQEQVGGFPNSIPLVAEEGANVTYELTSTNISDWMFILRTHLTILEGLLLPNGPDAILTKPYALDTLALLEVVISLHCLLNCGLFDHLLNSRLGYRFCGKQVDSMSQEQKTDVGAGEHVMLHLSPEPLTQTSCSRA